MNIAKGVATLEITMTGTQNLIHPTLIWDNENVLLVDTGNPGSLLQIRKDMKKIGIPFNNLTKVILTHQDFDHIGGLPEIIHAVDHKIEILAHEMDKPYIEGSKPFLKMSPDRFKQMVNSLSVEQREQLGPLSGPPISPVDTTIEDREVLPYCGGITTIFTPGHTPGHISLYLHESKVLIAGDAMIVVDGQLQGPNQQFTPDIDKAVKSLKKFNEFDIETVICYHGGVWKGDLKERLKIIG